MSAKEVLDSLAATLGELVEGARGQWSALLTTSQTTLDERRQMHSELSPMQAAPAPPAAAPVYAAPSAPAAGSEAASLLLAETATAATVDPAFVMVTNRTHLVCPADLVVRQSEFMQAVQEEAESLQLPFRFSEKAINWFKINLTDRQVVVEATTQSKIALLLNLEYIGRVAFVTQRTYLLPYLPPVIKVSPILLVLGVIALVGGALSGMIGLLSFDGGYMANGFLLTLLGIVLLVAYALRAPAARLRAKNKWLESVQDMFMRALITDEMAALGIALEQAVQAAIDRLFVQHGARIEAAEREKKSQANLDEELEKQYRRFVGG